MEAKVYKVEHNTLFQNNQSSIRLERNSRTSIALRTRHINVSYVFITDRVAKGEVEMPIVLPTSFASVLPTDASRGTLPSRVLKNCYDGVHWCTYISVPQFNAYQHDGHSAAYGSICKCTGHKIRSRRWASWTFGQSTGVFVAGCDAWRRLATENQTFVNLQVHFSKGNEARLSDLTAQQAGFHGAHALTTPNSVNATPTLADLGWGYCWSHGLGGKLCTPVIRVTPKNADTKSLPH